MVTALSRRDDRFTTDEIVAFLRRRIGEHLLDVTEEYETLTIHVDAEGYAEAARVLKEDERLAFDMFDCLVGVDAREEGFDVIAILYSVEVGARVCLRHRCEGGRTEPVAPTLTHLYRGAVFHERETWDMFGIEFPGHPGLAPRILTTENFEGWPLRKDFHLASREAKPWPGVKEPAELDEEGNVIERVPGPGDAPGPMALDEAMAKQAKLANPEQEAPVEAEAELVDASDDQGDVTPSEASEQPDARVAEGDDDRAVEDLTEAESSARVKAEDRRKSAAEARARKAAERADEGPATTPSEDVAEVPEGDTRSLQAQAPEVEQGEHEPDTGGGAADAAGGISETVDTARERGEATPDPAEAPVQPEGHAPDADDEGDEGDDEAAQEDV
jgi:NADH:ubiquinone oxidoreductase subunit C